MDSAQFIKPAALRGDAVLRLAIAADLARYKGLSREHTECDLRAFLDWTREHGLDPSRSAGLTHIELYLRWMQEVRRYKPATVSRAALDRVGFLPDLRHRRCARTLTRRARAPTTCPPVTDPGSQPTTFASR